MAMKRILVTGAAGFSGRPACRRFADSGCEVLAIVSPRFLKQDARQIEGAASILPCELTDRDAVNKLVAEAEPHAIIHLAGQNAVDASWLAPDEALAVNLLSTAYLLEAARKRPGCRMLVIGSMLRLADSDLAAAPHPYAFAKSAQVAAALAWHSWFDMPVIVGEPSNLIGPGGSSGLCGKIAAWAAKNEQASEGEGPRPFRLSSLEERRDFLDVRDAASAYEKLLWEGEPGQTYPLESGVFRTLGEVKESFDREAKVPLHWEVGCSTAASPIGRDASGIRHLGWKPEIAFHTSLADALQDERGRLQGKRLSRGGDGA